MALYRLEQANDLVDPRMVVAFDSWVDAGSAATSAARRLAEGGNVVATFDADQLYDYRSRRPTLDIIDGRPASLAWPELAVRRRRFDGQDLLVLTGPEPDYRWQALAQDVVALASELGIVEWISLGSIPAAVPHTRPVTILGTESRSGLLRGGVAPGPAGILRVPSAAVSVLDLAVSAADIAAVGYYAQIPHYVTGPYPAATLELVSLVGRHLGAVIPVLALRDEADLMRERLDAATAADESTREYVERLEEMVDEARRPSGDDLISEIEQFLREQGSEGGRGS